MNHSNKHNKNYSLNIVCYFTRAPHRSSRWSRRANQWPKWGRAVRRGTGRCWPCKTSAPESRIIWSSAGVRTPICWVWYYMLTLIDINIILTNGILDHAHAQSCRFDQENCVHEKKKRNNNNIFIGGTSTALQGNSLNIILCSRTFISQVIRKFIQILIFRVYNSHTVILNKGHILKYFKQFLRSVMWLYQLFFSNEIRLFIRAMMIFLK